MTACDVVHEVIKLSIIKLKTPNENETSCAITLPHEYDPIESMSVMRERSKYEHRRMKGGKSEFTSQQIADIPAKRIVQFHANNDARIKLSYSAVRRHDATLSLLMLVECDMNIALKINLHNEITRK
jgi:hypothetical protein